MKILFLTLILLILSGCTSVNERLIYKDSLKEEASLCKEKVTVKSLEYLFQKYHCQIYK